MRDFKSVFIRVNPWPQLLVPGSVIHFPVASPSASYPALTSPHPRVRLVLSRATLRSPA